LDAAFLIAVLAALGLLSAMIVARLGAAGLPARRIALTIIELWAVFAVWAAVFQSVSRTIGLPVGRGQGEELRDLVSRLAALPARARLWPMLGLAASLALLGHLVWSLREGRS